MFLKMRLQTRWMLIMLFLPVVGMTRADLFAQQPHNPVYNLNLNLSLARQNPVVRDYFLRLCLETYYGLRPFAASGEYTKMQTALLYLGEGRNLEQHVDRLTVHFLQDLAKRLQALRAHFQEVQQARAELFGAEAAAIGGQEARQRWSKSLKDLGKEAEDLRGTLALMFFPLDAKSDFKPRIESAASESGFTGELKFIDEQITQAERRISNFFFAADPHTVSTHDLRAGNAMTFLHRVGQLSKKLSKELR